MRKVMHLQVGNGHLPDGHFQNRPRILQRSGCLCKCFIRIFAVAITQVGHFEVRAIKLDVLTYLSATMGYVQSPLAREPCLPCWKRAARAQVSNKHSAGR
jgi:hypothetical protein